MGGGGEGGKEGEEEESAVEGGGRSCTKGRVVRECYGSGGCGSQVED